MDRLISPFVTLFERWMPDAFIFAVILTALAIIGVPFLTDQSLLQGVNAWGNGFWSLLGFTTQIATTMVTGYALACTKPVQAGIKKIAQLPGSAFQVYLLVGFTAALANLISWSLGLVVGAVLSKEIARAVRKQGIKVHYPLLVACAYSGFVIWELGLTSSIALSIATPDHPFADQIGIIPTAQTLFAWPNLVTAAVMAITLPFVMATLHPRDETRIIEIRDTSNDEDEAGSDATGSPSPSYHLNRSRILKYFVVILGGTFIIQQFGSSITLNSINFLFLILALLFARSPIDFVGNIYDGAKTVGSLILQYPFYAGIMGIISTTGMASVLAGFFIDISSQHTLPFWAFISGGLLNIFIPSGGGQWAVQAPVFIHAAEQLNVAYSDVAMAIAYGDDWTNMIQPFWTLPLLAVAGIQVKDMMGYLVAALIWAGIVFSTTLLVLM